MQPSLIYFEKHTRKYAGLIEAMLLHRVVRTVWGYRWLNSCFDAVVSETFNDSLHTP